MDKTDGVVYCPVCGGRQYSKFDKLYVEFTDHCVDCETNESELSRVGDLIIGLIN